MLLRERNPLRLQVSELSYGRPIHIKSEMKNIICETSRFKIVRKKKNGKAKEELHDALGVPKDGVSVEGSCWVEPETELLLSLAFAFGVNVGVKSIRVSTKIAQKFQVYLIPLPHI